MPVASAHLGNMTSEEVETANKLLSPDGSVDNS